MADDATAPSADASSVDQPPAEDSPADDRATEPPAGGDEGETPKARFQKRLNVILRQAVDRLEDLAEEVLERPPDSTDAKEAEKPEPPTRG